jgi:hypothetical protein
VKVSRKNVVLALLLPIVIGTSGGCGAPVELPEPHMPFGYFACEPPRGLRPPPSGCAFENEEAARRICSGDAIEVVVYLDARGRLIDAYMKDYRSPGLDACMFKEAQQWALEPALTCTGEPIPSMFSVSLAAVCSGVQSPVSSDSR